MKKIVYVAAVAAALSAAPAFAGIVMTSEAANGSNHLAAPGSTANLTFIANGEPGTVGQARDIGLVAKADGNARRTNVGVGTGALNENGVFSLAPNPYDGNGYFSIGGGNSSLTLTGQAFTAISVFIGSIDTFNTIQLLNSDGISIATYNGTDFAPGVDLPQPGDTTAARNRRVTFTGVDGQTFNGIKFFNSNDKSAFEFDNVSFTAAVPEPATWAMMLLGFGMVGAAARYRRRSANVRFA